MNTSDIIHNTCKEIILNAAMNNVKIREQLTFIEHIKLCEYVYNMSYQESVEILFELGVRDFESKFKTFAKYGAALIAGGLITKKIGMITPIGLTLGLLFTYLFRKVNDPCFQSCFKIDSDKKTICKYLCYIKGCDSVLKDIRSQIQKCDTTKNPIKCERGLNKALVSWEEKKSNYKKSLQTAKAEYVQKEAKHRRKQLEKDKKLRSRNERH